ncbi:MAG: autotransporter domain-containing protein [Deltaproteobacteria bacterium]|nr:autotransporter domain-containing protein [Deltaproteobacteria bacterium]
MLNSTLGYKIALVGGGVSGTGISAAGGEGEDEGNRVNVGFDVTGSVIGGLVINDGLAIGNSVTVSATVSDTSNDVYIIGGLVQNNVDVDDNDAAYLNSVTITNGAFAGPTGQKGYILGALVAKGVVGSTVADKGNSVNISGGTYTTADLSISGGSATIGSAYNNKVNVTAGSLTNINIYGANVGSDAAGFSSEVVGNSVTIGNAITTLVGVTVKGGLLTNATEEGAVVDQNAVSVTIDDDFSIVEVVGGEISDVTSSIAGSPVVTNNVITVTGTAGTETLTVSSQVVGGLVSDANSEIVSLTGNKVNVIDVTVVGDVYGVRVSANSNAGTIASSNEVNLSGATINGAVYGSANASGNEIGDTNSVNLIDGDNAITGNIKAAGKIVAINDGVNALGNGGTTITASSLDMKGGSTNNFRADTTTISGSSGNNGIANFSGTSTNNVTGTITASRGVFVSGEAAVNLTGASSAVTATTGGVNVTGESSLVLTDDNATVEASAGGINVSGEGSIVLNGASSAVTAATGDIDIAGEGSIILNGASSVLTATVGDIKVGDGSALHLNGAGSFSSVIVSDATKKIAIAEGGTLGVSATHDETLDANLDLANGSILSIGWSGSDLGSIAMDSGKVLTIGANDKVSVIVEDSSPTGAGGTILTVDSGTLALKNFLSMYDLTLASLDTELVLGNRMTLGEALAANGEKLGVSSTPNYENAAALFDRIEANPATDGDLIDLLEDFVTIGLASLPNPELSFKQLIGESLVNVTSAVSQTTLKAQGLVYGRLDRIRELDGVTPPAAGSLAPSAGDSGELNRVWVGAFGVWTDVSDRDHVYGYDYKTTGFALGYDRVVAAVPGLRLGVSTAFSYGTMDTNDNQTSVDINTAGIGVYASYLTSVGVFVDGTISYARAKNDYDTNFLNVGLRKKGSFDIDSWQFGARVGAVLKANNFQFIPSVGVRYLTFDQEGWTESINNSTLTPLANRFEKLSDHQVDIPIQLKINTTIESGAMKFVPELRLGWTIAAKRADDSLRVGFVGSPERAEISGIKPARNTFNAGIGFKLVTGSGADIFLNYDYEGASGFKNHQLGLGVGYEF